jgi:hypothetical protein
LNQVEQRIHRAILPSRAVLIYDCVNGDRGLNARQFVTRLITAQRFYDGDRAMLTIINVSPPPDHTEDLTGAEVVDGLTVPFFVVLYGLAQAQTIQPSTGNVAGSESG